MRPRNGVLSILAHLENGCPFVLTWVVGLALLVLSPGALLFAQVTGSATIRGLVKDQGGAVVPGAAITLQNEQTHSEMSTVSNEAGNYFFSAVNPGTYTIKVEMPAFKTYQQSGIAISPSETRGLDISLQVGAPSETVEVTSVPEMIKTETGSIENTITQAQIQNLSIISRSALELLRTLPGVVAPDETDLESVSFGGGANANTSYNVNGLRGQNNNISIDGSRVMDIGSNNGTIITANVDMVQEVTVQTSNYAAEHGTSGVQISAITRGGSKNFHGTVYDYIREGRFNANDRSNNYAGTPRPESKYQYPGFNIGGPVILPWSNFNKTRNKMFFFVGFEVQRQQVDPGTVLGVVPSVKQRAGDFSELLNPIGQNLNQPTGAVKVPGDFPNAGSNAPNNNLAPYIDSVGKVLTNMYPAPNYVDNRYTVANGQPRNRYNYAFSALEPTNRTQLTSRFDYDFSEKTKLYVRFGRETESQTFTRGLWWHASDFELPSHVLGTNLGRSIAVNFTKVFSPTMTNEILFSASRLLLDNDYQDPSKVSLSNLGIGNFRGMFPQQSPYAPVAIYSWGNGLGNLWEPGGLPLFAHNDSFSLTDNLAKVHKAHVMKFGFFVEQANKQQNFNNDANGAVVLGSGWIPGTTGNDYADLLVGRPAQYNDATRTPVGHFRFYNYEGYVQDSWKVRRNLTVEYGVRVAYFPNNFERNHLGLMFHPDAYQQSQGLFINGDVHQPNGVVLSSKNQISDGLTNNSPPQWAPRLNFAWDVNGKGDWVIRGGGGLFYNRVMGNYQYWILQQPPNTYDVSVGAYDIPDLTFNTVSTVNPYTRIGGLSISSLNPQSIHIPRIANMSFSVAHKLPGEQVLEVSYVGTEGRHLPDQRAVDIIPPGTLLHGAIGNADLSIPVDRVALTSAAVSSLRPFPAYGGINYYEYDATSSYHSLQATLTRRAGKSLQYFATYTFSKVLGTISSDYSAVDPIDARGRSYGILGYDRTHIFNLSYDYQIPTLARGFLANRFGRGVFSGWQMSGITTFASGRPIKPQLSGDIASGSIARAYVGTDASAIFAPAYLGDPRTGNTGVGQHMFSIDSLGIPGYGTYGPFQPPYYLRSPARWNHDVSLFKDFKFSESKRLQFRSGFFNLFNQAYANSDIGDVDLTLQTTCKVHKNGVPNGQGGTVDNVCDPTGGFSFTPQTQQNFGNIISKHGHRIIEFALKFYF